MRNFKDIVFGFKTDICMITDNCLDFVILRDFQGLCLSHNIICIIMIAMERGGGMLPEDAFGLFLDISNI